MKRNLQPAKIADLKKAVFYGRATTINQATTDTTIRIQEFDCREFAESHGLIVEEYFSDIGVSANEIEHPGINAMLSYLQKNASAQKQYAVLVHDVNRLTRNPKKLMELQEAIEKAGGVIVTPLGCTTTEQ